jgi:serine/threonine protein kinase
VSFVLERKNHQTLQPLDSPHIAKMLASYKRGDAFNIIFLKATTDLNHYLREEKYGAQTICEGQFEKFAIWKQVRGITQALGSISNIETPGVFTSDSGRGSMIGFHFDLKPSNILVDLNGVWQITDFGQAKFTNMSGSTSRVAHVGGTDDFAPPEYERIDERFSRKYDVWSLGCILLEAVAFAVRGIRGVKALDEARRSENGHHTDERFWQTDRDTGTACLKPAITNFMEELLQAESVRTDSSRQFLQNLLVLIRKMLEPVVERRIDIRDLLPQMTALIGSPYSPTALLPAGVYGPPTAGHGETNITSLLLREIRQVSWRTSN